MIKISKNIIKVSHANILAQAIISIVVLVSGTILFGWLIGENLLGVFFPNHVAMKVNTSFCFFLTGISLSFLNCKKLFNICSKILQPKIVVRILMIIVFSVALLTLLEYVFQIDFHIDKLLFHEKPENIVSVFPGRMAINTAINFALLGVSIFFATFKDAKIKYLSQIFVVLTALISLATLMGYLTDEKIFVTFVINQSSMAISSSILFLLLTSSVFLMQYGEGFFATVMRKSAGGILLRYLLPLYILIIFLVTILVVAGMKVQILNTNFAIALLGIIKIFLFTLVILVISKKIDKIDTDSLTKLKNRYGLQKIMNLETSRSERYKNNLTLLFLDIDNFKDFNDTYGHKEGDSVLVKLAETILNELRFTDYAFRYGGEEFLVLLPQTDISGAVKIAERIRRKFKAINFISQQYHPVHNTVSIGIAKYESTNSIKSFIDHADKAMYKAKKQGKDQVGIY